MRRKICYFYPFFYIHFPQEGDHMKQRYAYGYVRVSTHMQDELSPDSQERLIREYAEKNEIHILKVFFEIGVSGRFADRRPAFQEMIRLVKAREHPVDTILVWKYSRFARNQEESIVYKSLLKKQHRVDVISVSEPLTDGPFGSLIERIIEWMDEYYSIRLSGEVLRGMTEKAARNGYQSVPPLGYRAVGGGHPFVINDDEFPIVQYIFDQYDLFHTSPAQIARALNEMGFLTRRGNPFEHRTVKRILENPFYCGTVIWKNISFQGTHPTRLSKERYEARMQNMKRQYQQKKRRDIAGCNHWLSGLLKCSVCGSTLTFTGQNQRSPGFQCCRYSKGLHPGSQYISEKKIIGAIYDYFDKLSGGRSFTYQYRTVKHEALFSQAEQIREALDKLDRREARIRLAFENGADSLEEYKEKKHRLQTERGRLANTLTDLCQHPEKEVPHISGVPGRIYTVCDLLKDPDIDNETKGTFMRSLVKDIVYDKANGRLLFYLQAS